MQILLIFLSSQIDSLSLEQVIELALEQSPAYLESRSTLAKSRIQFYQSLSQLLPTTSASTSWIHTEADNLGTLSYTESINFSVPFFDLDVISAIVISRGQEKVSALEHKENIASLILNLKKSYFNLVAANELLSSAEKAIARAIENKRLVETKYNLGAASRLELVQAEAFYLQRLQDCSQAKTLEAQAQQELIAILDTEDQIYPLDSLVVPKSLDLPSLDSLKRILHKANLSIRLSQEMKKIGWLNLQFAGFGFVPRISLFYGYNTRLDFLIFDPGGLKVTKNYGINVSLPIFEIKSLIFNYLTAKKDLRIKDFSQKRVILESEKALTTTYFSLKEAMDRLQFAQKGLEAATEAAMIGREEYSLGTISLLDLLRIEEEYDNARLNLVKALSDFYILQAQLSYLLGELTIKER